MRSVAVTPQIKQLLRADAPVAIGVSGGKDSSAVAFATVEYLDSIGHAGPRVLIHSDLGVTEWKDSLPWCQKLAERLSLELLVVQRQKGDMMDRWEQRWSDNVTRYRELLCVQLILPWSTPAMRFCTSEMKTAIICRNLTERFPGATIVSVNGIRRQESDGRRDAPVAKAQPKLVSKSLSTLGFDWQPLVDWSLADVLTYLDEKAFPLHPAYTTWGMSRVSCAFCIMSAKDDIQNAARSPETHDLYRRIVRLELKSTFAFQSDKWLADVAPQLLSEHDRRQIVLAKQIAAHRQEIETKIPKHLLYTKGWPTCIPNEAEAALLCCVRRQVSALVGIDIEFTDPESLTARYRELFAKQQAKKKAVA